MIAMFMSSFHHQRVEGERQNVKNGDHIFQPETFQVFARDLQKMDGQNKLSACTQERHYLKTVLAVATWERCQSCLLGWQRLPGGSFKLVSEQSSCCGLPR